MPVPRQLDDILSAPVSKRRGKPVSFAIVGGREQPLSFYGDDVVDLSPYIATPGVAKRIFMLRYPARWRDRALDVLLAYWKYGVPGRSPPKASTVISHSVHLVSFLRWADKKGLGSFAEIRPIHVQKFIKDILDTPVPYRKDGKRLVASVSQTLTALGLAWHLREHLKDPLEVPPFGLLRTPGRAGKLPNAGRGKLTTDAIDIDLASKLYLDCKSVIANVSKNLADLHRVNDLKQRLPPNISSQDLSRVVKADLSSIAGRRRQIDKELTRARVACFVLIGMLTGMRLHEVLLLERNCWHETSWKGVTIGWIRGRTDKKRRVDSSDAEWIAPLEIRSVIGTLEKLAEIPRDKLLGEIAVMERDLERGRLGKRASAHLANRLRSAREQLDRLFLTRWRKTAKREERSYSWDRANLAVALRALGKRSGITGLHPRALRRTFAVVLVHVCGGDLRYLRVQFQHWSVETTVMYAQHELRDQHLVDDIAEEMLGFKTELIAHWLNPATPLAGPCGEYIKGQRISKLFRGATRETRRDLACGMASGLIIRPTGHSDCVSTGEMTCGGQGLYDAALCADCDSAVMDEKHRSIWELLGAQALELESLKSEGEVFEQLVDRSLKAADRILHALGSSLDVVREKYSGETQ